MAILRDVKYTVWLLNCNVSFTDIKIKIIKSEKPVNWEKFIGTWKKTAYLNRCYIIIVNNSSLIRFLSD